MDRDIDAFSSDVGSPDEVRGSVLTIDLAGPPPDPRSKPKEDSGRSSCGGIVSDLFQRLKHRSLTSGVTLLSSLL